VSLSITTTEGCSVDTVIENYIQVYPIPVADFDMSDDLVSVIEGDVKFTDQSEGEITNWFWDLGEGSESNVQNPNHRYEETGSYEVLLEVVSVHGCTSEAYEYVEVQQGFTFYVPNAFTPNNDQHNNKFQGVGEGVDPSSFQMSITNRWGEMIYHTGNVEEGWDGTFKGLQVEVGAYVYEISLQDLMGKEHYFRGHVSVVR
jgi:gliding motility-associated-like protein